MNILKTKDIYTNSTIFKLVEESTKDFIIAGLENHGFFFQEKVIEEISKTEQWRVSDREVPVSARELKTKIDIVASRDSSSITLFAIIECKKADPEFKTWIFHSDKKIGERDYSTRQQFNKQVLIDVIHSKETKNMFRGPTGYKRGINFIHGQTISPLRDKDGKEIELENCYDAFSIKVDAKNAQKPNMNNTEKIAKKDVIEDACRQVTLGTKCYAELLTIKAQGAQYPLHYTAFLPIVVTTAPIFIVDVESKNVDIVNGKLIDKNLREVKEVPWLCYNFKPDFMKRLDFSIEKLSGVSQVPLFNNPFEDTMTVFIVNSKELVNFLNQIQYSLQ